MNAVSTYQSPLGELLLAADEEGLTGMWFQGQKYFAAGLGEETEPRGPVSYTHLAVFRYAETKTMF